LQILDISEFTYGEEAEGDNVGAIKTSERVYAIHNNMDLTGTWMRGRFISLGIYLDTIEDRMLRQLLPSRASSRASKAETSRRLAEASKDVNFTIIFGGGCDDLDQDGDNVTDNCEEDLYPPGLSFPACLDRKIICPVDLCLNEYFQSRDEAELFIKGVVDGIDDCAGPEDIRKDFQQYGECGETKFEVTPVQTFPNSSSCHGTEVTGDPMVVMVGLDEIAPNVTCGFSSSLDGKNLFVQEGSASLVDTAFYFDIQENCGDVKVEVIVETNEYIGTDNEKIVALSAMRSLGRVEQAFLYVAPQSCVGNSASSAICRQDRATPFRFYEIKVTAVDKAGNEDDDTCWVVVKPADYSGSNELLAADIASSATRIPLSKLDLTWNNDLAPFASPSSAPSASPSASPSSAPSTSPSASPSSAPSTSPSASPSSAPSASPSASPSSAPSASPSASPSSAPSASPSASPSSAPSFESVSHSLCENFFCWC
jgi:hypothetical protein